MFILPGYVYIPHNNTNTISNVHIFTHPLPTIYHVYSTISTLLPTIYYILYTQNKL